MASPSLLLSFAKQTLTIRFLISSVIFSLLFLAFSMILINIFNFISIGGAPYVLLSKLRLFGILFIGSFQSISGLDLTLQIIIAVLFGTNLALIVKKLRLLRGQPNLHITLGSGVISLAAAGCASCGLSIVSFVGLGGALAALPFGGIELYLVAIALLSFSLIYNLNALYRACKIG